VSRPIGPLAYPGAAVRLVLVKELIMRYGRRRRSFSRGRRRGGGRRRLVRRIGYRM